MHKTCSLSELEQGTCGTVIDINPASTMYRRLQDIGLIKGTKVMCVQISPLGDPAAYLIRGAVIALRSEDSSCVLIECSDTVML